MRKAKRIFSKALEPRQRENFKDAIKGHNNFLLPKPSVPGVRNNLCSALWWLGKLEVVLQPGGWDPLFITVCEVLSEELLGLKAVSLVAI